MKVHNVLPALALLMACSEHAGPALQPIEPLRIHFIVANDGDARINIGYRADFADTLVDSTFWTGAVLVNPISPGEERPQSWNYCHLGCVLDIRIDDYWTNRSYRLPRRVVATPADTLVRLSWPTDTAGSVVTPYR